MVRQYPSNVKVEESLPATQNSDGNWVTSGTPETRIYKGRLEVSSRTAYIEHADGSKIQIQAVIYFALSVKNIKPGEMIKVYDCSDNVIFSGPCLQFSRGQLNARAWVGNSRQL